MVTVNEAGVAHRITKREAFFKTLVARAMKDNNRFAALLMQIMEKYDLVLPDESPRSIKVEFVTPPKPPDDEPGK